MGVNQLRRLLVIQVVFVAIFSVVVFGTLFAILSKTSGFQQKGLLDFSRTFFSYWMDSFGTTAASILVPMAITILLLVAIKGIWGLRAPLRQRKFLASQYRREAPFAFIWLIFVVTSGMLLGTIVLFELDQLYYHIDEYGWPYFIFSILMIFVVFDTIFYWFHRALHWGPLYKYFHAIHHATKTPHWLSQFNTSPFEHIYQLSIYAVILLCIPIHPIALLLLGVVATVKSFVGHLGSEIYPRSTTKNPFLSWSTTVTHHEQHHAFGPYNFSFFFTWWDKLMGTEHPTYLDEFERAKNNDRPISHFRS